MAEDDLTPEAGDSTPENSTPVKKPAAKKVAAKKAVAKKVAPAKPVAKKVAAKKLAAKKIVAQAPAEPILTPLDKEETIPHQDEVAAHAVHTDINEGAWIMRHVPDHLKVYAQLMRLDRPIGIWLLLLPCYWGIAIGMGGLNGLFDHMQVIPLTIAFTIGAVLMRGAGCIINDLWDKDIDMEVERTRSRPLASGAIAPDKAMMLLGILLAVSAIILFTMNWTAIAIGIVGLVMSVLYPLMKRVTFWPQAFLGLTFNLGILIGCAAVVGHITAAAFTVYLGAVAWTIAYDTVYARQDIDDDLRIGMKSTPILFGENLFIMVAGFMIVAIGFFILGGITGKAFGTYYAVLALPILHAYLVMKQWQPDSGESCLATFKAQRDFGLLMLLAFLFS